MPFHPSTERHACPDPPRPVRLPAAVAPSSEAPESPTPSSRTALAPNRQAQCQGRVLPPTRKPDRSTSIMARTTHLDATAPEINPNEKLTVGELCAELKVSRSTFYEWRQKRCGPRCIDRKSTRLNSS